MPKQALESLTESMFYLLMALTQGERCGTEITAFAAEITAGRDADVRDPWYSGNFRETYEDVVEGCQAFLDWLTINKKLSN